VRRARIGPVRFCGMTKAMRSLIRVLIALSCLALAPVTLCEAQTPDGIHGHVFRSNAIGLTYKFPDPFIPKSEDELLRDSSGRDHLILALVGPSQTTGKPRMSFLHDTKIRPVGLTRVELASRYLQAVRQSASQVPGVKLSDSVRIFPAGYEIWRQDYWVPAAVGGPPFNSGIVIPLNDRSLLVIQINAPSQSELDVELDSLRDLHFDETFR
jgi:hypothetical protein